MQTTGLGFKANILITGNKENRDLIMWRRVKDLSQTGLSPVNNEITFENCPSFNCTFLISGNTVKDLAKKNFTVAAMRESVTQAINADDEVQGKHLKMPEDCPNVFRTQGVLKRLRERGK